MPANRASEDHLYLAASWTAGLAIVAMALSVSATAILLGLTILSFLLATLLSLRQEIRFWKQWPRLPAALLAGAALYGWLVVSGLIHTALADDSRAFFQGAIRSEWSDIPLWCFGWIVFLLCRRSPRYSRIIVTGMLAFAIILVLTGIVAAFSEFRLARLIKGAPAVASAWNRPQHPFGTIGGIEIYRPIGFMNTRLTYAGLLVLVLPMAGAIALLPGRRIIRFLSAGIAALIGLLLVLNGSRSAQLGAAVSVGLTVFFALSFTESRRRLRLALLILAVFFMVAGFALLPEHRKAQLSAQVLERHTDFYRPVLWTGAGQLLLDNPILGTGVGNFTPAHLEWRERFVLGHPDTLYFIKNTPRGHAHNDLLHVAAIGGIPAALLFLWLVFVVTKRDQVGAALVQSYARLGCVAIFVGGVAQCYFQDDEVIGLFWAMVGWFSAAERSRLHHSSHSDQSNETQD